MTLAAPFLRIAAGRRRRRLRRVSATGVTASPRRPGHGKRRVPGVNPTQDLFGEDLFPEGLNYHPDFLSHKEEQALLRHIERLPFNEFEFHGKFFKEATTWASKGSWPSAPRGFYHLGRTRSVHFPCVAPESGSP